MMGNSKASLYDRRHKKTREGWAIKRVSTVERGRTQHGSLEAQETMIRRWEKAILEETGTRYKITRVIEEKASAKSENTHKRHELLRLVQLIELGAIDFIVVEKLDRLSRDEVFNLELMKKIIDYNVELFFIEGGKMDFRNQGDRWRFKLDNIRAGEYSADLSEKVVRKRRIAMVEAGKDGSPSPTIGLNRHPDLAGKYEVDWNELKVAIDIMGKFCEFGGSREGTLKYCKEAGYTTKKWWTERKVDENGRIIKPRMVGGDPFTWSTLMTLLTNPKYRGINRFYDSYNQYPDRQDKQGFVSWEYHHRREHGDIVKLELLNAVDDLAKKADHKSRESEFLLSGILRASTGSRYGGDYTKKKAYYHNRKVGKRFGSVHLHKLVMDRLKQYLSESGLLEKLLSQMAEHKDFGLPKVRAEKEWLESEIKKIEQATLNFSEAIRSAAVAGDKNLADIVKTLLEQKELAQGELDQLKAELHTVLEQEERFKESFRGDKLKDYLRLVMANFSSLHHLEQKRVLRTIIPEGIIHTGESANTLELHINLDPKGAPVPSERGRASSASTEAKIYQFQNTDFVYKPEKVAVGAENDKGHFCNPPASGAGVQKWPYVRCGRRDWIRTSDLLHPKQVLYQAEPRAVILNG
jgi:DNA invertase Pin-like site-specific DNA recombinase